MKTTHGHETTVAKDTGSAEIQPRHRTVSPRLAVVLFIALALLSSLLAALAWTSSEADEGDVVVAAMTTPRNSHSATLLQNGAVLVVGGWDGVKAVADADLYNPRTQTWTPTGAPAGARVYHAAVRLPDGRVLVTGGWARPVSW